MATLVKDPELPTDFPKSAAHDDHLAAAADGAPPGSASDAVNDAHVRPSPTLHMFDDYLRGLRAEEKRERDRLRARLDRKRLKAAKLREAGGWRDAETGEAAYLDLLADVVLNGALRADRTGVGCLSVFGRQMRFDLGDGFPLLTTKKLHLRSIVIELLWFLRGDTNVAWLQENGVSIWNEWADETGDLGPVYGKQWRSWAAPDGRVIDQISSVVRQIKDNPESRRLVVSAWNPADVDAMALPPCHCLFQFAVLDGKLNLQLYQRSADVFLGVPFNIASYAALLLMVAQATGLKPGEFVHTFGDAHLYLNHLDQAAEQMSRAPRPFPTLRLSPMVTDLFDFRYEDFALEDYDPHPHIKGQVAV